MFRRTSEFKVYKFQCPCIVLCMESIIKNVPLVENCKISYKYFSSHQIIILPDFQTDTIMAV